MAKFSLFFVLVALVAVAVALPFNTDSYRQRDIDNKFINRPELPRDPLNYPHRQVQRFRRSPDGWVVRPDVGSDHRGVDVEHQGDNHDFRGSYSKGRGGENWRVGGTFRFRRSPDGWVVRPDIGSDHRGVDVEHQGDNHDFRGSYSKGQNGENWRVGGTFRFKRSPSGWVVRPDVGSDHRGVDVEHQGDNHDFRGSYSKGQNGENWRVGGTIRF